MSHVVQRDSNLGGGCDILRHPCDDASETPALGCPCVGLLELPTARTSVALWVGVVANGPSIGATGIVRRVPELSVRSPLCRRGSPATDWPADSRPELEWPRLAVRPMFRSRGVACSFITGVKERCGGRCQRDAEGSGRVSSTCRCRRRLGRTSPGRSGACT